MSAADSRQPSPDPVGTSVELGAGDRRAAADAMAPGRNGTESISAAPAWPGHTPEPLWITLARSLSVLLVLGAFGAAWLVASDQAMSPARVLEARMALDPGRVAVPDEASVPPSELDWQPLDQQVLAQWFGPYWLHWRLAPRAQHATDIEGLRLSMRAASRLFWNGQFLGDNGHVAHSADREQPGRIDRIHALPRSSQPADAVDELLVFASSQQQWLRLHSADAWVEIGPLHALYQGRVWPWLVAALAVGGLLVAWAYFFVVQRGRRRSAEARLLVWLGAVGIALPLVEAWRPLFGYPYPLHGLRLGVLLSLHLAAALLLPAYLARRFSQPTSRLHVGVYIAALLAAVVLLPGFDSRGASVLLISLLSSVAVLLHARGELSERIPILVLLASGVLALVLAPDAFLNGWYFLLLAVLMGFLLLRHGQRQLALDRDNALLRAERSRLSLQLLRRGMQPHWLMNTLTSLQELIEQAPDRASRLVEHLADQFDRLRESSDHERVPLVDELALCRSHLDIVGLALGQSIPFQIEADDLQLMVPPGVLHAQVENALTHAGAHACAARPFRLVVRRQDHRWLLELRAARGRAARRGQGTGTRYIEASLAAVSPGRWRYAQFADGEDWVGRIELACAS